MRLGHAQRHCDCFCERWLHAHTHAQPCVPQVPQDYDGRVIVYRFDYGQQDDEFTVIMRGLAPGTAWSNGVLKVGGCGCLFTCLRELWLQGGHDLRCLVTICR